MTKPDNTALTEARIAIAEVRALAKEFGVTHTLVNQALHRIEESVKTLAGTKDADVKGLRDDIKSFREEQGGRWLSLSVKVNAILGAMVLALIGIIYAGMVK